MAGTARFTLGRPVHTDALGTLYDAVDRSTGRACVVRVFHERTLSLAAGEGTYADTLARDAEARCLLAHPAVVPTLEAGDWETTRFLASDLDWSQGMTLTAHLLLRQPAPKAAVTRAGSALCSAFGALQQAGMPCPGLRGEGVILADSACRLLEPGLPIPSLPMEWELSPWAGAFPSLYMAPEHPSVSPASEVYTIGAVLLAMATGDGSMPAFLRGPMFTPLGTVLMRATGYWPSQRFPSPSSLGEALACIA